MRRIFLNDEFEAQIIEHGYAVVKNFATEELCDDLKLFFEQTDAVDKRPFTITNWCDDAGYRHQTFEKIVSSLSAPTDLMLQNYKPVMGVFTAKRPGPQSEMLLHQDWSLVDEAQFRSVSVWLATCDMDHNNGNLQVVRKSHLFAGFPRGINVPVSFENITAGLQEQFLTDIPLKKGDAVVFDHRLLHCSPVNNTDMLRLAAVLALIPEEADLIHYFRHPDNHRELEMLLLRDGDFHMLNFFDSNNKPKHIKSLGFVPADFRQISLAEAEIVCKH